MVFIFQINVTRCYLTNIQITYIHNILVNPHTPIHIHNKTREILFNEYYGWLKKQVRKFIQSNHFSNNHITTDELYQYATKGFLKAINNYHGEGSLVKYAEKFVIGEMHTGLLELIPLKPVNKYQKYIKKEKILKPTILPPENYWIFDKFREYTDRNKEIFLKNGYLKNGSYCFCKENITTYQIKIIVCELLPDQQKLFFTQYDFETLEPKHKINEICELLQISHETYRKKMNIIKKYIRLRLE